MTSREPETPNRSTAGTTLSWIFRGSIFLSAAFLFLVTAAVLLLQSSLFETRLSSFLELKASENLNGSVRIGNLKGTLFSDITLEDVVIEGPDHETVAELDRVSIRYLLFRLFSGILHLDTVTIDGLQLHLSKNADGDWNILRLISRQDAAGSREKSPLPFLVRIQRIEISNSRITISSPKEPENEDPLEIFLDQVHAGVTWDEKMSLSIPDAALTLIRDTSLPLVLSGEMTYTPADTDISLDTLRIESNDSSLVLQGNFGLADGMPLFDLSLTADSIHPSSFSGLFSLPVLPGGSAGGTAKLSGSLSEFSHVISMSFNDTRFKEKGNAGFDNERGAWADLSCKLRNLDLSEKWLPLDDNISGIVSMGISLSASGIESLDRLEVSASAEILGLSTWGIPLEKLQFDGGFSDSLLTIDYITASTGDSHLQLSGTILPESGNAQLDLMVSLPDSKAFSDYIAAALPAPYSHLSLDGKTDISIAFNGWFDHPHAEFTIDAHGATMAPYGFDDLHTHGTFNWASDTGPQFEKLSLSVLGLDTDALDAGAVSIDGSWTGWISDPVVDFSLAARNVTSDRIDVNNATVRGTLSGKPDSESAAARVTVSGEGIRFDQIETRTLNFSADLKGPYPSLSASAVLDTGETDISSHRFKGFSLSGQLLQDTLSVSFIGEHENGSTAKFEGTTDSWKSPQKEITLNSLRVTTKAPWVECRLSNQRPVRFSVDSNAVSIFDCLLNIDDAALSLSGLFSLRGEQNLSATVDHLDLAALPESWKHGAKVSGILSGDVTFQGSFSHPMFSSRLRIEDLAGYEIRQTSTLSVSAQYSASGLSFQGDIIRNDTRVLSASGKIPVAISISPFSTVLTGADISADIETHGLKLSDFPLPETPNLQWDATMDTTLAVSGSPDKPDINGNIIIRDGHLSLPGNNLTYETLTGNITVSNNLFRIDQLLIEGDREGRLDTSGTILLKDRQTLEADLTLNGNNFFVLYKKAITARISPELHLSGGLVAASLTGEITITESKLDLDLLSRQRYSEIQVVQNTSGDGAPMVLVSSDAGTTGFLSSLSADILVKVPNNAWLKGQDVNAEIFGEISVKKNRNGSFLLSGPLSVLRGNYYFMGKNFQLTEGGLEFMGAREINPNLDIFAQTQVGSNTIIANLHGTAKEMSIDLSSDPVMEKSDIISYLIFGRPTDNLGGDQAFNVEKAALSYTGGLLAVELRNLLGDLSFFDSFSIDTAGSENTFGSVTLGKYLTPEIFVSHRQGLSEGEASYQEIQYELTPQIKLETQIGRDQTSSVDITWEFDF